LGEKDGVGADENVEEENKIMKNKLENPENNQKFNAEKVTEAIYLFGIRMTKIIRTHIFTGSFYVSLSTAILVISVIDVEALILFVSIYILGLFVAFIIVFIESLLTVCLWFVPLKYHQKNVNKTTFSNKTLKSMVVVLTSIQLSLFFVGVALHSANLNSLEPSINFLICFSAVSAVIANILSANLSKSHQKKIIMTLKNKEA